MIALPGAANAAAAPAGEASYGVYAMVGRARRSKSMESANEETAAAGGFCC